jgi:hypothetical protein
MVNLGRHLRRLSQLRLATAMCLAVACLAAVSAAYNVRLLPPGISSKSVQERGAHTQILIDDRKVSVLQTGFDTDSFYNLQHGTVLAGSLLVQAPTRNYIAQLAHIPESAIQWTDSQVPIDPPLPETQPPPRYSVTVAARPTPPILDVYAQAPTSAQARALVDASAAGLGKYLAGPGNFGLRVTQLGTGADVSLPASGDLKSATERFLIVFLVGCFVTLRVDRSRRAWSGRAKTAGLAA